MAQENQKTVAKLIEVVDQMLSGNKPPKVDLNDIERSEDPLLNELAEKLSFLNNQYEESYQFILELSRGKLDTKSPTRNMFINPYKQLQSELRYLAWQIQEIANGNYDQRVHFSGEFSYAINKLTMVLRERQRTIDEQKEKGSSKD